MKLRLELWNQEWRRENRCKRHCQGRIKQDSTIWLWGQEVEAWSQETDGKNAKVVPGFWLNKGCAINSKEKLREGIGLGVGERGSEFKVSTNAQVTLLSRQLKFGDWNLGLRL